jgi:hypothetical protein
MTLAKGRNRGNREPKKPKAEKKSSPPGTTFLGSQPASKPATGREPRSKTDSVGVVGVRRQIVDGRMRAFGERVGDVGLKIDREGHAGRRRQASRAGSFGSVDFGRMNQRQV